MPMTALAFFLLNIIQGITEFLPISSSGHLLITEWLYGISEHGLEAFLHLPTAIAIGIVFWKVFFDSAKDKKTWPVLLAAIIPAGIVGLLWGDTIDAIFYSPLIIGINQIVWGTVLLVTSMRYKPAEKTITSWKNLSWVQSLKIGLIQILALIPGTSRSGVTTLGGMWTGLAPQESAAFSFIVGFPLITAASLVGLYKLVKAGAVFATLSPMVIIAGMAISMVLGIIFMKLFVSKRTLMVMKYSAIYRILIGILILVWLL